MAAGVCVIVLAVALGSVPAGLAVAFGLAVGSIVLAVAVALPAITALHRRAFADLREES